MSPRVCHMKPKMARGSGQQTAHPDGSLGRKYECCQTTNKEEGVLLWMQEHAIGQAEQYTTGLQPGSRNYAVSIRLLLGLRLCSQIFTYIDDFHFLEKYPEGGNLYSPYRN